MIIRLRHSVRIRGNYKSYVRLFFLINFLLVAPQKSKSFEPTFSAMKVICSKNNNCNTKKDEFLKKLEISCEIEMQALGCENIMANEPALESKLRKCDAQSICDDFLNYEREQYQTCLRGYKNALVDTGLGLKDLAVSLQEFVQEKWAHWKRKISDQKIDHPDDENTLNDSSLSLSDIKQKAKLISRAAERQIQQQYLKYSCFNAISRKEMACYALGAVVDPVMLASATFKGTKVINSVKKTLEVESDLKQIAPSGIELRNLRTSAVSDDISSNLFGTHLRKIPLENIPRSMSISEYQAIDGSKYQLLEKTVKMPNGDIKKTVRELPIDSLTGAYDANFPVGREFLASLIKEQQGKVSFAFIDVNNLGYVNKNFAKGREAGDTYLKKVSEAIKNATDGKAEIFKLGGDEFALIIHETDPEKLRQLTDKIITATHRPSVHEVFKQEKIIRAKNVRDGQENIESFKEFAPFSKEGISVGVTQVGFGENLETLLVRSEKQAQDMKIKTKEALNIDATKYGGAPRDLYRRSDLTYQPKASTPILAGSGRESYDRLPDLSAAKNALKIHRDHEVYRFGALSVVNYNTELGETITRYERYLPNSNSGKKKVLSREVVMNQRTGFIDASHEGGQLVLHEFINSVGSNTSKADKSLLWINTENLGKVNYFFNGTQSGDALLKATSEVIKKEIGKNNIPFKMNGSEFIVAVQDLPEKQLRALETQIEEALMRNPAINKVFEDQKKYLELQLKEVGTDAAKKSELNKSLKELEKIKPQFTLRAQQIQTGDTLEKVLQKIQRQD